MAYAQTQVRQEWLQVVMAKQALSSAYRHKKALYHAIGRVLSKSTGARRRKLLKEYKAAKRHYHAAGHALRKARKK